LKQAPVNRLVTPSPPHRAASPIPLTHSVPYYCPSNTIFNLPPPLAQPFPTGLLSFLWTAFSAPHFSLFLFKQATLILPMLPNSKT